MSVKQGGNTIAGSVGQYPLNEKNITNCITKIPQDIKLELTNGTLTLKAGSKVYVPNGPGVFKSITLSADNSITGSGSNVSYLVCCNESGTMTYRPLENCVSGAGATTTSGFAYNITTNEIYYYNSSSVATTKSSLPICIVSTNSNGVFSTIDQVFNGFGYIGSTIFALPGVKGLMPSGRNADGTLNNTAFTVNNVIKKTTSYDFGFDCNFMIRDGSTIDYVKNSFYLISEKTPSYKQYARLYQTTKNKCYYGEPSSWEPIQFVFCGTMTLDSNGKIIKFDSRLVFEAVDSTEGDYVVDYQRPTAENNYTWYRKYKSGWVEQGGQFTATSVADGSGTAGNNIINLPIKMANDRYWYSANTQVGANGWNYANGVILNARATTTLTLKVVAGTGDLALYWEVKGMAA